ncbi:MAG: TRAP transporter fused permease subunit [Longimicrobiales bacterium]|nr:TRAP transporter fused permease subunit [Longimicrobiales bacterium]
MAPGAEHVLRRHLLGTVALAAAGFHLFAAGVHPFTALVQRPVHLALMGILGFWTLRGAGDRAAERGAEGGVLRLTLNAALPAVLVLAAVYLAREHGALVARAGAPTALDLGLGGAAVVAVLVLARRTTGWGLVVVALAALAYALLGPRLPGPLAHRGYGPARLVEHLFLTTEGVWGIPLGVSADFVFLFVLFGAVLEAAGGGALLMVLAGRVAGRSRGGPAKTAAVASALMGSLSGSAVANVVTTGAFTIPVMRRAGFRPLFAGAVEAAASTGGQLMPPVMGAGAFILATWTSIPYARVAAAALIPALLYYLALLLAIHFRAGRMGVGSGTAAAATEASAAEVGGAPAGRAHLLLSLALLVVLLALGRSPMRAAFWAVVSGVALAMVRPTTRLDRAGAARVLETTARGAVQVAAACAAAGIVVGVASLTGIGLRMSELIVTLSGGHLLPALVLTAAGSVILGMGLPTTAAYVVLAALGAPALVELGVPLLAAHLFIFYFGCISNVTPPVSLAAYAAAGLSGADPLRTGLMAMGLALPGFLIPFLFVHEPALLLAGPWWAVAATAGSAALGVAALAAAVMGFLRSWLGWRRRAALAGAALLLLVPGVWSDVGGLGAFLAILGTDTPGHPPPSPPMP